MNDVRIVPLYGGAMQRPRSTQLREADDDLVDLVFTMFYLRADGHHIVVDTGAPRASEIPQHRPVTHDADQDPGPALARTATFRSARASGSSALPDTVPAVNRSWSRAARPPTCFPATTSPSTTTCLLGGARGAGTRFSGVEGFTINTHYSDLASYFRSVQHCLAAADVILPSHDARVHDRDEYR